MGEKHSGFVLLSNISGAGLYKCSEMLDPTEAQDYVTLNRFDLSGTNLYVPYVNANKNVDIGTYTLSGTNIRTNKIYLGTEILSAGTDGLYDVGMISSRKNTAPDQHLHTWYDVKQQSGGLVTIYNGFNSQINKYDWKSKASGVNKTLMDLTSGAQLAIGKSHDTDAALDVSGAIINQQVAIENGINEGWVRARTNGNLLLKTDYTERVKLSGTEVFIGDISGAKLNINGGRDFTGLGFTLPATINSNGRNYFINTTTSGSIIDILGDGSVGADIMNVFEENIEGEAGLSGAGYNIIWATNHYAQLGETFSGAAFEIIGLRGGLNILSGAYISGSSMSAASSQTSMEWAYFPSSIFNVHQIRRDVLNTSGGTLRGLYIEDFDKDQADTPDVWENNHFDYTYAIYSAGGDVKLDSCEFTNNDNVKLTRTGGVAIKLTAGENLSGGLIVTPQGNQPNKVVRTKLTDGYPNGSDMPIGVVLSDTTSGADCWIVVSGVAEVYNDGASNVIGGYFLAVSQSMSGAAVAAEDPAVPATAEHWREIGHAIDTKIGAGLVKAVLHFN